MGDITDLIGSVGVTLVLLAYFLLHINSLRAHDILYSLMNFSGACMILISLYYHWNFPSFMVESIWAVISLFGVYKSFFASAKNNGLASNSRVISD